MSSRCMTLKQVARPSIFGDPDFFLEEAGARYFNTRDFFGGEGQVILIPILTQLVPAVYFPPWVVLPTQGVGSWVCFARWSRIFTT